MPQYPSFTAQVEAANLRITGRAVRQCMAQAVLSLVDPAAGATDDLKAATATVASEVVWTAADLEAAGLVKLAAHGARALTFTTAGVTPADAPASAAIVGTDRDGNALTETRTLAQTAATVTTASCFASITSITMPAADGTNATIAVGIADKFGLPSEIKVRDGYPVRIVEMADGDIVSTGGGSATATNQAATATNQAATATNQAATATNQATTIPRQSTFGAVVAPATALGTIDEGATDASASTQPGHAQSLDVAFPAGWEGGNITITGVGPDGLAVNETYTSTPGSTVAGTKAFATIDANGIVNSAPSGAGDAATVQTGVLLGVAAEGPVAAFLKLTVNGVAEAFAATNLTNKTFQPTTAPNGTNAYEVLYTVAHNHTQDSHNHTQDSHNHTQDSHNHTQDAHSHSGSEATVATAAASPPYGAYTPSTPPDGSLDFLLVYEQVGQSSYGG